MQHPVYGLPRTLTSRTLVNKGKKRQGRSYREKPRPGVLVNSTEPSDDPGHLFAVVGPKRSSPQVARRAKFEQQGGRTLVVGGFEYDDEVVGTHRPVDLLEPSSMLLGECVGLIASLHSVPDVSDP